MQNPNGVEISKNDEMSRILGCQTDVLDFSGTETGTHKMLKAKEAFRRCAKANELIALSSGNYAKALKFVAEQVRKKVHLVISKSREHLKPQLEGEFSDVEIEEDFRDVPVTPSGMLLGPNLNLPGGMVDLTHGLVEAYAAKNGRSAEGIANVTSHHDILMFQGGAEMTYVYTGPRTSPIYNIPELRGKNYDYIFVPTGGGEILCDIAMCFTSLRTKIFGICPMLHSLITGHDFDPDMLESYADKLTAPTVTQMREFLHGVVLNDNVKFIGTEEEYFKRAHKLANDIGLDCEPSGAAGCVALLKDFRENNEIKPSPNSRVLIVNTGNGEK